MIVRYTSRPLGFRRDGSPIWPIAGGSDATRIPPGDASAPDSAPQPPQRPSYRDPTADAAIRSADGQPRTTVAQDGQQPSERFDFPAETPLSEMTSEQRAEYWREKAQKHERQWRAVKGTDEARLRQQLAEVVRERDELRQQNMTEQEKAVKAAREEGEQAAARKFGARLVDAEIRAVSAGRLTDDQRATLLDGLDRSRFLTDSGDVDTDKVTRFIEGIAPAMGPGNGNGPDLGQGRRPGGVKPSVASGRELYEQRRRSKTNA